MQPKLLGFASKRPVRWKRSIRVPGSLNQLEQTLQNFHSDFLFHSQRCYTILSIPKPASETKTDRLSLRPDEDRLLTTAFNEAAEILAVARKKESHGYVKKSIPMTPQTTPESLTRRNNITKIHHIESVLDICNEASAVDGLLRLTSHPRFSSALSKYRKLRGNSLSQNDVVTSLHNAFISVINWLCSTLSEYPIETVEQRDFFDRTVRMPSKASILLTHMMHLTERSEDLDLPLSIPQYQNIAAMIAKHSSSSNIASILLDLSRKVNKIYGDQISGLVGPIKCHFFSEALEELLERNRISDMVDLLKGSLEVYKFSVDLQTGTDLLAKLKNKVDECVNNKTHTDFLEADAMELALILQKPIIEELTLKKKEWENYNKKVDETFGHIVIDEGDFENDDDDDFDDDFNIHADDPSYKLSDSNDEFEEVHQSMVKEMIYLRDDTTWLIPDVTSQLRRLNPDDCLFFTKDFEEDLISELMDDEDDYYNDGTSENDRD